MTRSDIFWGVDFSCASASIGWKTGDHMGADQVFWNEKLHGGERLHEAQLQIKRAVWTLANMLPAVFVYVEQPSGSNSRSPQLAYMAGAIQAAIYDELSSWWKSPVEVTTVTSGAWKKEVLGRGDCRKPKKGEDFTYEAILWCREHGVETDDDNVADAICIAEYASRVVSFVS